MIDKSIFVKTTFGFEACLNLDQNFIKLHQLFMLEVIGMSLGVDVYPFFPKDTMLI